MWRPASLLSSPAVLFVKRLWDSQAHPAPQRQPASAELGSDAATLPAAGAAPALRTGEAASPCGRLHARDVGRLEVQE